MVSTHGAILVLMYTLFFIGCSTDYSRTGNVLTAVQSGDLAKVSSSAELESKARNMCHRNPEFVADSNCTEFAKELVNSVLSLSQDGGETLITCASARVLYTQNGQPQVHESTKHGARRFASGLQTQGHPCLLEHNVNGRWVRIPI